MGGSLAEVARACAVNPNVLHRWRRELRDYGAKAFSGNGKNRAAENRLAELERRVGQRAMEIDFCGDACSMSRSSGNCKR
jgi:transposase-like protein